MFGLTRRNQDMTAFNPWREMEEFEKAFFGAPMRSFFDTPALAQFRTDGFLFHIVDFAVQLRQICVLRIAAFQVAGGLDELLHGVVQPHLGSRLPADEMRLHLS